MAPTVGTDPLPSAPRPGLAVALAVASLVAVLAWAAPVAEAGHAGNPMDGVHRHAPWSVYVDGERRSFDADRYQLQARHVHVEGGNGDLIHVHVRGVTFGEFLSTLGWGNEGGCLVTDRGDRLCQGRNADLRVLVDGAALADPWGYEIQDGDVIVLDYRGPDLRGGALQAPAATLGVLAALAGAGYAALAYRRHRRRRGRPWEPATRPPWAGGPRPPHRVRAVRVGAAAVAVGLVVVGASAALMGPAEVAPGPRSVDEGGFAEVRYLAYTPNGTVGDHTLAEGPADPGAADLVGAGPDADSVRTWAGTDRPAVIPSGWQPDQLYGIVPAVREALQGRTEGDTFAVGPLPPEEAYGPVDESLNRSLPRTVELNRTVELPRENVRDEDGRVEEGDRVDALTPDPRAILPAVVTSVDGSRVTVRLDPDDGERVRMPYWNATARTENDTVRLRQNPAANETYGPRGDAFRVTAVNETHYVRDGNPALAGETVLFRVRVVHVPPPGETRPLPPSPPDGGDGSGNPA